MGLKSVHEEKISLKSKIELLELEKSNLLRELIKKEKNIFLLNEQIEILNEALTCKKIKINKN